MSYGGNFRLELLIFMVGVDICLIVCLWGSLLRNFKVIIIVKFEMIIWIIYVVDICF